MGDFRKVFYFLLGAHKKSEWSLDLRIGRNTEEVELWLMGMTIGMTIMTAGEFATTFEDSVREVDSLMIKIGVLQRKGR